MAKRNKHAIQIPYEWFETCADLLPEEFQAVFMAMKQYDETGQLPDLPKHLLFMMKAFIPYIDRRKDAYTETCEKRAASGSAGGTAKATKKHDVAKAKKDSKDSKASKAGNSKQSVANLANVANLADKDNDIDNDIDKDKDIDIAAAAAATCAPACEGSTAICPEPSLHPSQPDEKDIAISLPLKDGNCYDVTQSDIDAYSQQFKDVDIVEALGKYQRWLLDRPQRLPGAYSMPDKIKKWLSDEKPSVRGDTHAADNSSGSTGFVPSTGFKRPEDFM